MSLYTIKELQQPDLTRSYPIFKKKLSIIDCRKSLYYTQHGVDYFSGLAPLPVIEEIILLKKANIFREGAILYKSRTIHALYTESLCILGENIFN